MQTAKAVPYKTTCVSAGPDWMTATARGKGSRSAFEDIWQGIGRKERAAGVEIKPAALRDYRGWRAPGVFYGERHDDSIIVLSGAATPPHWQSVAEHADNVSRLDLQVTLWTHGEQPQLGRYYWNQVRRLPPQRGRPREFSLTQTKPKGETLYVGKRTSDGFGRVYDWSSAHKQGEPRTLWRQEVEFKRHMARGHCAALLGTTDPRSYTESVVGEWFERRGVRSSWSSAESPDLQGVFSSPIKRDVLLWFETSVSKTIARAIKWHGPAKVFEALHLLRYVIDDEAREEIAYAYHAQQALHGEAGRRDRESAYHHDALDQGTHGESCEHGHCGDCGYPLGDDRHHNTCIQKLHLFQMARQPSPYSGNDH